MTGYAGKVVRAKAADQGRGGETEGAEATIAGFETAIIDHYRRREASVEKALVEMHLAWMAKHRVEDITEAALGQKGELWNDQRAEQEGLPAYRSMAEPTDLG